MVSNFLAVLNESHLVYRPVNVFFPPVDGSHTSSHVRQRLQGRLKTESNCPVQITVFTANTICQPNLTNEKKFVYLEKINYFFYSPLYINVLRLWDIESH